MYRLPRPRLPALLMGGTALLVLCTAGTHAASLLEVIPQAPGSSVLFGISGDGTMVFGQSTTSGGVLGPTVWGVGAPSDTPFAVSAPTLEGYVTAITPSANAIVVNWTGFDEAFVRRGAASFGLNNPAGGTVGVQLGLGISDDGSRVVGRDEFLAVYWDWNGAGYDDAIVLPLLTGGTSSRANAINGAGTIIVGNSNDAGGTQQASYWSGAGFSTITSLDPGGLYATSAANAISDDGSTIVGYVDNAGIDTATIWNGAGYGTTTLIGPVGATSSYANAVSADGSIVGGTYEMSPGPGASRAFLYTNGQFGDLETLLTSANVDLSGLTLNTLVGLSDDGHYIAVNDVITQAGYLVFYDGIIGGVTSASAQTESADRVMAQRQAASIQPDLYAGILVGDLQPTDGTSDVGALGLYGSAVGGARGTTILDAHWSLSGGVSIGAGDYGALGYQGVMAAAALRYDADPFAEGFNVFGQAGGDFGVLSPLTFRRDYANGAGTATGVGVTDGYVGSVFARLGVRGDLSEDDQLSLSAEIGQHWLATAAYAETQSATNPFPAAFGAATDTATVGKVAAAWTHQWSPALDMTLRVAFGTTLASQSNLAMTTTGFGTVQPAATGTTWAEAGLRLGWRTSETTRLDLYATGMSGERVGLTGHVGAGFSLAF